MKSVLVELIRHERTTTEMQMVKLEDSDMLRVGNVIVLQDDEREWTVHSVHRCQDSQDGNTDHYRCFL